MDTLRAQARPIVSLVAEDDPGQLAGHIMFSPVSLAGQGETVLMGLAPMAVLPAQQNTGIGSALVEAGLEACSELGAGAVVVLGHPDFYPRFGFTPASGFGIDSEYDVPDEVFMAQELQPGGLSGLSGRVQYHAAFANI